MSVPLSGPWITDADRQAVLDVMHTRHLALGPALKAFEAACAARAGVPHAVAMSSGTMALSLTAVALGWGPGDEILTPSFSFVASANTIMHAGAKPVFVDIDPVTWNMDPTASAAAATAATRGLQVVDVFGLPCDLAAFEALATKHGWDLVEDACEAVGARHADGRSCGAGGRAGVWAFYPNKQITTGEGGMFLTADAELAAHVRSLGNQGRGQGGGWFDNVRVGWNGRLSDISAALGTSQLSRLDEILRRRRAVAALYDTALADVAHLRRMPDLGRSWFVYVVALEEPERKADFMRHLTAAGIQCGAYFAPIHLMPHMRAAWNTREGQLPVTEDLARRTVALPFFTEMTADQVEEVAAAVRSFFQAP